jgi:hypothetical protein
MIDAVHWTGGPIFPMFFLSLTKLRVATRPRCSPLAGLRHRHRDRLIQGKFQQRFSGDVDLLAPKFGDRREVSTFEDVGKRSLCPRVSLARLKEND